MTQFTRDLPLATTATGTGRDASGASPDRRWSQQHPRTGLTPTAVRAFSSAPSPDDVDDQDSFRRSFIGQGHSSAEAESFLRSVLGLGLAFKKQAEVRAGALAIPKIKKFKGIPQHGQPFEALLDEFRRIAQGSTNFGSRRFLGFPDAGNSAAALGAAILTRFLNQNMINQDFCAPEATFIEMELVHWLRCCRSTWLTA